MEDSRRLLHGTILPVEHVTGLTVRRPHGTQIEVAREEVIPPPSSPNNPHCHDHTHFVPSCETCRKAQAAFLPYQGVGKQEPASRSFGFEDQMSEADIHRLTHAYRGDESLAAAILCDLAYGLLS